MAQQLVSWCLRYVLWLDQILCKEHLFCIAYLYLLPPFVFISLSSWAYVQNFFNDGSSVCSLCRLSMSRVSNWELATFKTVKFFFAFSAWTKAYGLKSSFPQRLLVTMLYMAILHGWFVYSVTRLHIMSKWYNWISTYNREVLMFVFGPN